MTTGIEKLNRIRKSSSTAVLLVSLLLLMDFMLMSAFIPVVPLFLWHEEMRSVKYNNYSEWRLENGTLPNLTSSFLQSHKKKYLSNQTFKIGLLIASRPLVQVFADFFIGPLVDKIGFAVLLCFGCAELVTTATMLAFGKVYAVFLGAEALHGIGSACVMSAGMTLVASKYTDEVARGRAMSYVLFGLGIGVLLGSPYGSAVTAFVGRRATFMILAGVILTLGLLFTCVLFFNNITENPAETEVGYGNYLFRLLELVYDPYILLCVLAIGVQNMLYVVVMVALPTWLIRRFNTPSWMVGFGFVPTTLSYSLITNLFGCISIPVPKHAVACVGLIISATGIICFPFAESFYGTIAPLFVLGIGGGLLEPNTFPVMGMLVDKRHHSAYGSVYALGDISLCIGSFVGSLSTGALMKVLSVSWIAAIFGAVTVVLAPFLLLLKKPLTVDKETSREEVPLVEKEDSNNVHNRSTLEN